ncbi:MAG TPA: sterol desaturase family protein [Burkholderiales bacterium]|nr:sterol desaturase family protein [Burkholderiales bacterium]
MNAEDLVALMIPATYLVMLAVEQFGTGRKWPEIRFWRTKGITFFVMLMTINAILPSLVPEQIAQHHLFDGAKLGVAGGIVVGYLAVSLANATLHRAYHRFSPLWRYVHQLHHSPQRLDISGAVLFTPLEVVNNVLMFLVVNVFILGIDPLAAAAVGYVATFYGLFQHFNVRTPQWLGYLIQRPESHSVHHRRGFHAYNYSDLPLWDMLWGTFRNPKEFHGEVGFEREASGRMGAMLVGRDVNEPLYGPRNQGRSDPATNPA